MDRKKALLVVAGGRVMPDILALYAVQPHLIVTVTSEQGWDNENSFVEIAKSLPNYEKLIKVPNVNAYDLDIAKQACIEACQHFPDREWDWTFSISSGPKITGIAAYEVAKEKHIPCLYIDTQHEKVVSLIKDIGVIPHKLFHMDVHDYMRIYQRKPKPLMQEEAEYRAKAEKWGDIARTLALSPYSPDFTRYMHEKKEKVQVPLPSPLAFSPLLQALESLNAITLEQDTDGTTICAFTSKHFAHFLGSGDWLEVYVWNEVEKAKFADNCQWGYEIRSAAKNELDVALTYKSQLIFAECKTEGDPFTGKTGHLDRISSKAEMLGRTYVTKVFITNASKTLKGYANFYEQAKLRGIVVATAEDLPDIGQFLRKQAEDPDFPRK